MWEQNDQRNYALHKAHQRGQICNDSFAAAITRYAADPRYTTFLEIGTWNGLGSTKAFADGFAQRSEPYVFYSLECNADKSTDAAALYQHNASMHILNEVVWNQQPDDFYEVFPQALDNALFRKWHDVDIKNMQRCPLFLARPELPPVFDIVLLDGGEFTTYYEFQLLKDRCKVLMLDDILVDKCKRIVAEIKAHPDVWRIVEENTVRNGYLVAEHIAV
jgi:hypothetical protein